MSSRLPAFRAAIRRALREVQRRRALAATDPDPAPSGSFTLARIIGNDLWPRHAPGQALRNLGMILRDEPDLPGCRKLFVLNRIIDPATQVEAEAMVRASGHELLILPFVPSDYAALTCDTRDFGGDAHFDSPAFAAQSTNVQSRERLWACAAKVRCVMNVNGARNAALEVAQARGDWAGVLDGSCFVPVAAWDRVRADIAGPPSLRYLIIPMLRLTDNDAAGSALTLPNRTQEEPQIAFHPRAAGRFDLFYPYGMLDKAALLNAIGVPGPWEDWGKEHWLPAHPAHLLDRHRYAHASASVLRLTSGVAGGKLETASAQQQRYQSRNAGILRTLAMLDDRFATPDRDRARRIMGLDRREHPEAWDIDG